MGPRIAGRPLALRLSRADRERESERSLPEAARSLHPETPRRTALRRLPRAIRAREALTSGDPELVQRAVKIGGIAVDAERSRGDQLVPAVPAREQPDAEHLRAPRAKKIPHGVTDHVALVRWHAETLLAFEEKIGLGLRPQDVAALDDHRVGGHLERDERL